MYCHDINLLIIIARLTWTLLQTLCEKLFLNVFTSQRFICLFVYLLLYTIIQQQNKIIKKYCNVQENHLFIFFYFLLWFVSILNFQDAQVVNLGSSFRNVYEQNIIIIRDKTSERILYF